MRTYLFACLAGLLFVGLSSCRQDFGGRSDFYALPAKAGNDWQMVVEIPAGTNLKLEYDAFKDSFLPDSINGQPRIVNFLPYPGNYGFIPSTLMDAAAGGDGDPVDVLLISEALPTGTVVRIQPIAALLLKDDGEADTKIIAIPRDSSIRSFQVETFQQMAIEFPAVRNMVEDWFLNYKGPGRMESLGWRNEIFADQLMTKSLKEADSQ
ncbi:MAG: inorganic diphosphatase [Bacteroidetes bacterium]|nr:inorganic diphosphatase [Bacteroidota bacterium]